MGSSVDFDFLGGTYTQSVDNRGRSAIASGFMQELRGLSGIKESQPIEVVVSCSFDGRGIGVYPLPMFKKLIGQLKRASSKNTSARELKDALIQGMEKQVLDKQNRIRLPQALVDSCKIEDHVTQLGSEEYILVISKEEYEARLSARKASMSEISKEAFNAIGQLEEEDLENSQAL